MGKLFYNDQRLYGTWAGDAARSTILMTMERLLAENPLPLTAAELACALGWSAHSDVLRHLHRLRAEDLVTRVGPRNGGGWVLVAQRSADAEDWLSRAQGALALASRHLAAAESSAQDGFAQQAIGELTGAALALTEQLVSTLDDLAAARRVQRATLEREPTPIRAPDPAPTPAQRERTTRHPRPGVQRPAAALVRGRGRARIIG